MTISRDQRNATSRRIGLTNVAGAMEEGFPTVVIPVCTDVAVLALAVELEIDEVLVTPARLLAANLNCSKVLPVAGGLTAITIPDSQCVPCEQ